MKLAVIGGGSTYTPEVVDGIVRLRADLLVDELALNDTNEERLDPAWPASIVHDHHHAQILVAP